jgi:hypothetical protein
MAVPPLAGRVLGPGAGYVLKGAQLGTAFGVAIGVTPPSGCHLPMDVGVDEIGQRGWSALHKIPWGIAKTEYFVKSGVNLVQCGAGPPPGVMNVVALGVVSLHSLPDDSVYHCAVKSLTEAWAANGAKTSALASRANAARAILSLMEIPLTSWPKGHGQVEGGGDQVVPYRATSAPLLPTFPTSMGLGAPREHPRNRGTWDVCPSDTPVQLICQYFSLEPF